MRAQSRSNQRPGIKMINFQKLTEAIGSMNLAERQKFWKTLFEKKNLAPQLPTLATKHAEDGITYGFPQYGQVHVMVEAASALGDNFMSDTFIVKAAVKKWGASSKEATTYSTFIKVLPTNVLLRQAAYESHVHHREIKMYHQFFDLLREIQAGQSSIKLDVPDVYYVHLEEIVKNGSDGSGTCILLEDLKSQGYCMSDKVDGADYRHCQIALTSLAHYHALTFTALRKWINLSTGDRSNIPPKAEFIFEKTMFDASSTQIIKDWSNCILDFAKEVERPDLLEWLTELVGRLDEIIEIDTLESSGPLACILHGDFWNNNMLFKYEKTPEGLVPVALKLIDFQISRVGHPLSDILYFLYTSAMPETREKHMIDLLRHYFDTLTTSLKVFGIELTNFTWEDFLSDYKKRSLQWFFMGAMVMSMVLNKKVVTDLQDHHEEEKNKAPKPDSETKLDDGMMSQELQETMMNLMGSHKLSDNVKLTDRILRLIIEVKALNSA